MRLCFAQHIENIKQQDVEDRLKILELLPSNYLLKSSEIKHSKIDKIEFYAQNLFEKHISKYKWINQNADHELLFMFYKQLYFDYNDKLSLIFSCFNYYQNKYTDLLDKFPFPDYLMLLPAVLSAYNNNYSSLDGAGMWRFRYIISKRHGLIVDDFVDQRRHPYLSTLAACSYLELLMDLYHDNFDCALCAFLSSPIALNNALSYNKDNYIFSNLSKEVILDFHFYKALVLYYYIHDKLNIYPTVLSSDTETKVIYVKHDFYIKQMLEILQIDSDEFVFLNPEFRYNVWQNPAKIVLPIDKANLYHSNEDRIKEVMDSLLNSVKMIQDSIEAQIRETIHHIVKRGETLSQIAQKYDDVTVNDIVRLNGLKSADIIKEGQKLIIKKPN